MIPESFFPKEVDDDRPGKLITNKAGEYPKKLRIGVYDQTILCQECEQRFNRVDNYAQKVLLENESKHRELRHEDLVYGYELDSYDYPQLKSFFISLLWRASISTHAFYRRISLGPYESIALDMFKSEDPIPPDSFSVILAKFDHPYGKSMLCPISTKFSGINYNQFYLGGYIAYIKTDNRPTPKPFSELMLSPNLPLKIISREFLVSKEYPLFLKVVSAQHNWP